MRISFDIDDTLVCDETVPREPPLPVWWRWRYDERLRLGTRALMLTLVEQGCEVCIYTSSPRSIRYLRGWFERIGVTLGKVVNEQVHRDRFGYQGPSKNPGEFGIDLHVDNSEGVQLEGQWHGFHVVVVAPDDPDWAARVLEAVAAMKK